MKIEWDGIIYNEKTRRGDEIMRVSKNGNIRIVYRRGAVQGKYAVEHKTQEGYWDHFSTAYMSSDFLSEAERNCSHLIDEPLNVIHDYMPI